HVNYVAKSVPEALRILATLIGPDAAWTGYPNSFKTTFDGFFAGTHGAFASQLVLDALKVVFALDPMRRSHQPAWRPLPGFVPRVRVRKHHAHVMPNVEVIEVERILRAFGDALGLAEDFHVEDCGQLLFHVHAAVERAEHSLPHDLTAWWWRLWAR